MQSTVKAFSEVRIDDDATSSASVLQSPSQSQTGDDCNHETTVAHHVAGEDLGRSIQAGVEAIFDTVLSTCLSLDDVMEQEDDVDSTTAANRTKDRSVMSAEEAAINGLSPTARKTQHQADEPNFQRRGRFLVWPATFGYDFDTHTTART